MSETSETIDYIVGMLRANARGERYDDYSFTSLADRIEAAWKHESAEIESSSISVGGIVEASRQSGNAAAMR